MTVTSTPSLPAPDRLGGNLLAAGSTLVWAAGFPAAEGLLATWDPVAAAAGRFAMGLLLLVPLWLLTEGVPKGFRWAPGLILGAVGFGGAAVTLIWALAVTDPVTVAVIASASPLCAAVVEWALERRRLSGSFLLGLGASVLGGVIATAEGGGSGGNLLFGAALTVASCLLYSWASHEAVRRLPGQSVIAQTTVTAMGGGLATGALFAAMALTGRASLPPDAFGARDLGLLAVYGMGAIAVTQILFIGAVRRIGVALSSFHFNIAPFYVMLILVALGGEWSWAQALGAAVVAVGVVVAQR
ncbi:DMT family transporter [Rubellimicrobium roseum]|uniref:DMT family transporter n=1 Tax=Rubellimicrobium roseum TaxID=687525 RepID=A0A5C4NJZ4_9RHOB|nr:DMT family transporter [Rubellimicrobium roseum]TNC74923.1 DMT family transporter [Rubellimicrobium roseum]